MSYSHWALAFPRQNALNSNVCVADDHARITLKVENSQGNSDYINASAIVSTSSAFSHRRCARLPQSLTGTKAAYRCKIQILMQRLLSFSGGPTPLCMFCTMNINDCFTANTPGEYSLGGGKRGKRTCARLSARFSFVETKLISGVLGKDCFWPWVMLIWH